MFYFLFLSSLDAKYEETLRIFLEKYFLNVNKLFVLILENNREFKLLFMNLILIWLSVKN